MPLTTQPFVGTFVSDPAHSSFQFSVKHMELSIFRASFDEVEVRLTGSDDKVNIEGRARVESISITNPPEFRETVVNGAEFFDAAKHPEVTFTSEDLRLGEDGSATLVGELMIKDSVHPVTATGTYTAPAEDPYGAQRGAIELNAVLDRREWGLNWQQPLPKGGDVLGYEIEVTANIQLVRQAD